MRIALPLVLCSLLSLTGCTSTFGPYVADVRMRSDGTIRVTRCVVNYPITIFGPQIQAGETHCTNDLRRLPADEPRRAARD